MSSIPEIELNTKLFLDKIAVLYGASDSGKSTVIKNILYLLKEEIHQIVVFAGNVDCIQTYLETVPKPLIHRKVTAEILKDIWDRQDMLHSVYARATDLKILEIFCR